MGLNYGEVDEITHITVGDREVFNGSITSNSTITIDKPDLFGGDESEGGIQGTLDVMFGAPDQAPSSKLAAMVGHAVSAFRKRTTMLFDGMVCALSKYPKPWAIRRNRRTKGWDGGVWYPEKVQINLPGGIKAMNPAHIIYEALTNRDWGDKKPRSKLDDAAFRAAADRYYAEGFGLCIQYTHQSPIKDFIYDVQNHVGANVFQSPTTGLWTIRSVRDDYDVNTLPLFTPGNGLLGMDDDDNAATVTATNEIIVLFTRVAENKEGQVRLQNAAGIRGAGGVISETVSYSGIPTPELAMRVAQRDLRAKFSAKKYKVRLNRRAYSLEEGGVFRVSDPARGLQNLVLRIGKIDYGTLNSGTITVSAVLDVFGLPANSYVAPQPSTYTPPSYEPEPVADRMISEATYRDLVRTLSASDIAALTPGANLLTATGAAPTGMSLSFELETRVGIGNWNTANGDFCPSAIVVDAIPKGIVPVSISMTNLLGGSAIELGSACAINGEIFRVDAINLAAQTVTIARGCIDTVPAAHAAGSRILFYQDYLGVDRTEYAAGVTVQARLRTRTGAGLLSQAGAPIDNYVMQRRRDKPYAPGNLRFNGAAYPEKINGPLLIEWSHRDRVLQADQLIDQSIGDVGPEPGLVYFLSVKDESGVVFSTQVLTDTGASIPELQQSGPFEYVADRDLRIAGLGLATGVVADTLNANVVISLPGVSFAGVRVFQPVNGGYLSAPDVELKSYFVDGNTGAITNRVIGSISIASGLVLKTGLYQNIYRRNSDGQIVEYDPYVGWAICVRGANYPSTTIPPAYSPTPTVLSGVGVGGIKDRRANTDVIVGVKSTSIQVEYHASDFTNRRIIFYSNLTIDVFHKSRTTTGAAPNSDVVIQSQYALNPEQLNSASGEYIGFFGSAMEANSRIGVPGGVANGPFGSCIIFGSLLYVSYISVVGTQSTEGKPLNITNIFNSHFNYATLRGDRTNVYSINASGDLILLGVRTGMVLADQVSATQGVEVINGAIRLVNSTTGIVGSVIATLPSGAKANRVAGDPPTETFYIFADNYFVYRYDLSGSLLASMSFVYITGNEANGVQGQMAWADALGDFEVSAGYLYLPYSTYTNAFICQIEKDLSARKSYLLKNISGDAQVVGPIMASPSATKFLMGKMYDELVSGTDVIAAPRPRFNSQLTVELKSNSSGVDSHQKHEVTLKRTGWGLRWGEKT